MGCIVIEALFEGYIYMVAGSRIVESYVHLANILVLRKG